MLNLNEFIPEDETIQLGDEEFVVTSQIPEKMILKINGVIMGMNENPTPRQVKAQYKKIKKFIYGLLIIKNDKKKVKLFLDKLDYFNTVRVMTFLSNYIKECWNKKKIT